MNVYDTIFEAVVHWIAWGFEAVIFAYFISYFLLNILSLVLSFWYCRKYSQSTLIKSIDFEALEDLKDLIPPVTLVVPAYNEERVIAHSIRSLLALSYSRLEVVVVNDGSKDGTLDELIRSFSLRRSEVRPSGGLPTKPVKGIYISTIEPRVVVVDKVNGGKADSINAGINFSQSPYFMGMDADSLFEPEAVSHALRLILEDPEHVVAVGGVVRGINGSIVDAGRIRRPHLLFNFWVIIQVIEYLRSFLAGRTAWSLLNGLIIIPGAFGLFQKAAVVEAGGYATDTVTEDFELTLRMHRYAREKGLNWRILLAPDAVCWTEMPASRKVLSGQRKRWHEGLLQTILLHRKMLFNWRYGVVGLVALPYELFYEAGGPLIEILGLVLMPVLFLLGWVDDSAFVVFTALAFFAGVLFSLMAVLIDQIYFPRYHFPRDAILLLAFSLIECFGYRQLYLWWRLEATWNFFFGTVVWRVSERSGFATRAEG
ncbi:MAG: glycosyltransferase [Terriglobia bacterium]